MNIVKQAVRCLAGPFFRAVCWREYHSQKPSPINERPIEYSFLFRSLLRTSPATVLDVGTGATALPSLLQHCRYMVTAVDNVRDYWPKGMINRHYYILNDDITNTRLTQPVDFIICISVLQHIRSHGVAVRNMLRLLKPGGHLMLAFPYNEFEYVPNAYDLPDSTYGQDWPFICQIHSRAEVDGWLAENNGEIVRQEFWELFSGDYWSCGKRLSPPRKVGKNDKHHHTCILIRRPLA